MRSPPDRFISYQNPSCPTPRFAPSEASPKSTTNAQASSMRSPPEQISRWGSSDISYLRFIQKKLHPNPTQMFEQLQCQDHQTSWVIQFQQAHRTISSLYWQKLLLRSFSVLRTYCTSIQGPLRAKFHWAFQANASAHIPHLGSAQCFSKQYLCPPHSLSFLLPSAWLPLRLLVSLLSFFAAHSSFPLHRCSTTYQSPPRLPSMNAGRHSLQGTADQGTGQETSVSDNHVHTRLSNPTSEPDS